jgi:autotransporter-associated beta strand protein
MRFATQLRTVLVVIAEVTMNEHPPTEEIIFLAALERATPQDRAAYIEDVCRGYSGMRQRVLELLGCHDESCGPLDRPPGIADPIDPPPVAEGSGTIIGRYKLLEEIAEGGMGVVYMAEQQEPVRRKVALKIIKPGMDSRQVIARFEAERQALATNQGSFSLLNGQSFSTTGSLTNSGTIEVGAASKLTVGGNLALAGSSSLDFGLAGSSGLISIAGSLTTSGTTSLDFTKSGPLAAGYTLATYQQTNAAVGDFTLSGAPGGYRLQVLPGEMILGADTWQFATSGSWGDGTKWSFGTPPSGAGVTAVVGAATSTPWSITLDGQQTLGALIFTNTASNAAGYTLATGNSGSLVLNNLGAGAEIVVTGGSQAISANVTLGDNLTVTSSAGTTLRILGNIGQSSSAESLTLNGPGKLVLSGTDSYTGGTYVSAGTLIAMNPAALASGSNLTVGNATLFAPMIPDLAASGITPSSVPEPNSLALLTIGVCSAAAYRRLRSRRKEQ